MRRIHQESLHLLGKSQFSISLLLNEVFSVQVPSFQFALFLAFSSYYVFHLEYPKAIKNVMFFLQDYILSYPDSLHWPATYLATASDIKKLALI